MPLGTLSVDGIQYLDVGNGRYIASTSVFGGPRNEFRITPGRVSKINNSKPGQPSTQTNCSITRIVESDITLLSGEVNRCLLTATLQLQVADHITVLDVDNTVAHLSSFVTQELLNKVLSGAA